MISTGMVYKECKQVYFLFTVTVYGLNFPLKSKGHDVYAPSVLVQLATLPNISLETESNNH